MDLGDDFSVLGVQGETDTKALMIEFFATRRFGSRDQSVEVLAGARYVAMELGIEFPLGTEVRREPDFIDAIIGARFQKRFAGKWRLALRGDVGGFGAGSEFSWNVSGLVGYQFADDKAVWAGYRILDIDYETGRGPL